MSALIEVSSYFKFNLIIKARFIHNAIEFLFKVIANKFMNVEASDLTKFIFERNSI